MNKKSEARKLKTNKFESYEREIFGWRDVNGSAGSIYCTFYLYQVF